MAAKYIMLILTSADNNNNKFYEVSLAENGTLTKRWGRVGQTGQSSTENGNEHSFNSVVRAKKSKGYRETEVIAESAKSEIESSEKLNLQEYAKEDLSSTVLDADDKKLISSLVDLLVETNKHQISAASSGKITIDDSGVIKTPLGLVNNSTIEKARKLLTKLKDNVDNKKFDSDYIKTLEDYLSLIPQKVPAQRGWGDSFLTNFSTIEKQADLLEQLDASVDLYSQKKKEALDKANEEKNKGTSPRERLFDCSLTIVKDKEVFDRIEKMYNKTINKSHVASKLKLVRVYEVSHKKMKTEFDLVKDSIGNVKQLWHGTRVFNVLSILKSGLFIPKSNAFNVTGRMFGNGIYMSDQSTKSLNYAYGYWDAGTKDNHCFMFLLNAAMGKEYNATNSDRGHNLPKKGYHSTFAEAGKSGVSNNEMIVYNDNQLDIAYLCEFKA